MQPSPSPSPHRLDFAIKIHLHNSPLKTRGSVPRTMLVSSCCHHRMDEGPDRIGRNAGCHALRFAPAAITREPRTFFALGSTQCLGVWRFGSMSISCDHRSRTALLLPQHVIYHLIAKELESLLKLTIIIEDRSARSACNEKIPPPALR